MSIQPTENQFLRCLPENFDRSRENSPREEITNRSENSSDDCIFGALERKKTITRQPNPSDSLRNFITDEYRTKPADLREREIAILHKAKPVEITTEETKPTQVTTRDVRTTSHLNPKVDEDWWSEATTWIKTKAEFQEFKNLMKNPMSGVPRDNLPTWGRKIS